MRLRGWLAAGVFAAAAAKAEDAPERLPPVTVTAERPAADLSTIEAGEIQRGGASSITELLRQIPGVHLDRSGLQGGVSSLYLRGADPNFTAVFLDGVKINDPTNTRGGSYDFSPLAADAVHRVEVLRGPVSALYGSDAMAGTVHIASARGQGDPRLTLDAAGGSFGQERSGGAFQGAIAGFDYAARGAVHDSGITASQSSAHVGSGHLNLGWTPSDGAAELRLGVHHAEADLATFPEDSGGPRYAVRRELDQRDARESAVGLGFTAPFGRGLRYRGHLGVYGRDELTVSPGVAPGMRDPIGIPASRADNTLRRVDLNVSAAGALGDTALAAGFHAGHEAGRSDAELELLGPSDFELERDSLAAFIDADHALGRALLEASVRVDKPESYGEVYTPRLRLSVPVLAGTAVLGAARGFKLPSFFALGHPIVGNPDLRAERSEGVELGWLRGFAGDQVRLSAAVFHLSFEDAIDLEEGPPPRLVNRDRIDADGAELGFLVAPAAHVMLRGHVSHVVTEIVGTTERLRNRPRWTGALALHWEAAARWRTTLTAVYVGRQLDSSIPTGDRELAAWLRPDASLAWQATPALMLRLDADNLSDVRYEELMGFPGPRRGARLGLRYVL